MICIPAEGKGFEPSSLIENRVSSAVRPTVSGYLPNQSLSDPGWTRTIALLNVDQASSPLDYGINLSTQWTHRESNPDLLLARQASSR